jgi:hypothetical protein
MNVVAYSSIAILDSVIISNGHAYVNASVSPLILSNFAGGARNSRNSDLH